MYSSLATIAWQPSPPSQGLVGGGGGGDGGGGGATSALVNTGVKCQGQVGCSHMRARGYQRQGHTSYCTPFLH